MLNNLREYLNSRTQNSLTQSLYTAFIHKYPDKISTQSLTEFEIDQVMWAYDKQARYLNNLGNITECFNLYEKALTINDNHTGCICNYALTLSKHGLYTKNPDFPKKAKSLLVNRNENSLIKITIASVMTTLGKITSKPNHFQNACSELNAVLLENPNNLKAIFQYSLSLMDYGELTNNTIHFQKALLYIDNYLTQVPNDIDVLINRSITLLALSRLTQDPNIIQRAFESIKNVIKIDPSEIYNLACYYSITNQIDLSKQNLLIAEKNKRLPENSFDHLTNDKDLDNVRTEQWFIDLLERLKEKEQKDEAA